MRRNLVAVCVCMPFIAALLYADERYGTAPAAFRIPPGMEVRKSGDVDVLVPKGAVMHRSGDLLVLESAEEYSARRFERVEARLRKIEKELGEIKTRMGSSVPEEGR